jgi:hypothetical protein
LPTTLPRMTTWEKNIKVCLHKQLFLCVALCRAMSRNVARHEAKGYLQLHT